jgi:ferritin-like metal-binding protein YciE
MTVAQSECAIPKENHVQGKEPKAAQATELKAAVARLEKVFGEIEQHVRGNVCETILGITKEAQEIMKEYKGTLAHDAGLLAAALAAEHYEISRYGTMKTWASELGLSQAVNFSMPRCQKRKRPMMLSPN